MDALTTEARRTSRRTSEIARAILTAAVDSGTHVQDVDRMTYDKTVNEALALAESVLPVLDRYYASRNSHLALAPREAFAAARAGTLTDELIERAGSASVDCRNECDVLRNVVGDTRQAREAESAALAAYAVFIATHLALYAGEKNSEDVDVLMKIVRECSAKATA